MEQVRPQDGPFFCGKIHGQFGATEQVQPKGGPFSMVKYTDSPTVGSHEPRNKYDPGKIYQTAMTYLKTNGKLFLVLCCPRSIITNFFSKKQKIMMTIYFLKIKFGIVFLPLIVFRRWPSITSDGK